MAGYAAGAIDGLIGLPAASWVSNMVTPGSVNLCSDGYKIVAGVAGVASLFIPGGGQVKAVAVGAIKATAGAAKTLGHAFSKTARESEILTHALKANKKSKQDDSINVYRAVGIEEYNDIINSNTFAIKGNAMENGKYFFDTIDQAKNFANWDKSAVAIFKANAPKNMFESLSSRLSNVESGGRYVPESQLSQLTNIRQVM